MDPKKRMWGWGAKSERDRGKREQG